MVTVVYYTSNQEEEKFEAKIRQRLVESVDGRWPIISVSQKPIDLGTNICVGEVGACNANAFRQLQIGIENAATPFAIAAESDCLYPPEYFDWMPPTETDCYRYPNVWIMSKWLWRGISGFRNKVFSECAQIAGCNYWLHCIKACLTGRPQWSHPADPNPSLVFDRFRAWGGDSRHAVINIKTTEGLRQQTPTIKYCLPEEALPYWGTANNLRAALWDE